jgi:hypothetical protein
MVQNAIPVLSIKLQLQSVMIASLKLPISVLMKILTAHALLDTKSTLERHKKTVTLITSCFPK